MRQKQRECELTQNIYMAEPKLPCSENNLEGPPSQTMESENIVRDAQLAVNAVGVGYAVANISVGTEGKNVAISTSAVPGHSVEAYGGEQEGSVVSGKSESFNCCNLFSSSEQHSSSINTGSISETHDKSTTCCCCTCRESWNCENGCFEYHCDSCGLGCGCGTQCCGDACLTFCRNAFDIIKPGIECCGEFICGMVIGMLKS